MTDPTPRAREDALERLRVAILTSNQSDALDAWLHVNSELRTLRAAPAEAEGERERDRQDAAWFRWLRDNPQAAAFTAALVAKLRPHGPDLGATMASGEVVGVMEDEKNPEYRYQALTPTSPHAGAAGEVTEAIVEAFRATWDGQKTIEKDNRERIRVSLTAALRAARGGGAG